MTVQDPPLYLQSDAHTALHFRQALAAIMGTPLGSFAGGSTSTAGGGGHGIINPGDLAVTEDGTPNMSVNVAAGRGFVRGTEAADQGVYLATNDGTVNMSIGTADGSNPRDDIVVMQIQDAGGGYSGSDNRARLFVVQGTPAGSPSDPALPVNSLPLARVRVGAGVTSITNANITDLRKRARGIGGQIVVATSADLPTSTALWEGLRAMVTGEDREYTYSGSAWIRTNWYTTAGRTGGTWRRVANQSVATATPTNISWDTEDFDSDSFLPHHATTGTTFTVPSGVEGLYTMDVTLGANISGRSFVEFVVTSGLSGTQSFRVFVDPTEDRFHASRTVPLTNGDTVVISVFQSSGANQNFTGALNIFRIGR